MTLEVKHKFTSLKGDGSDLTQVQPSNWNDTHDMTMATGKVLGRATAGAGAVEEIDWTAFGRSWLNAASASAAQGLLGPVSNIANQSVTYRKLQLASAAARIISSNVVPAKNITGAANNGVGLIRLTMTSTSGFVTGQKKIVAGVVGTTEANDEWTITVVDATHIDLQGSTFTNNYVSGGTIGGGYEEHTISDLLDFFAAVARGAIPVRGAAAWAALVPTSAGQSITFDGTDSIWGKSGGQLFHANEEVAAGNISAYVALASTWSRLPLNQKVNDISGASLSSNQLTLPAGTYDVIGRAPACQSGGTGNLNKMRLRNITDNTTAIASATFGWNGGGAAGGSPPIELGGRVVIGAQKVFELQYWTNSGTGTGVIGGSRSAAYGEVEVYGELFVRKVY